MSNSFRITPTRRVPLRLILVLPFVLQVFTAVGLTGWISLRNGQKAVNELADRLKVEASDRIASHLSNYLAVPRQLNQVNFDAIELGLLNPQDLEKTGHFFWKQMQVFNVGYINFATPQEEFIGVERLDDGTLLINETTRAAVHQMSIYETDSQGKRIRLQKIELADQPVQDEEWYAAAAKAGHPVWSSIYQWDDKPVLSISSSYPIYDKAHRLKGVIGIDLILSQISTFLSQFKLSPSSQTFILEKDGALVASSGSEIPFRVVKGQAQRLNATESANPLVQATARHLIQSFGGLEHIQTSQHLDFNLQGDEQFVQVTPWHDPAGLDWLIVVVVPKSDFMAAIDANTHTTILLCFAALAMATLSGLITSRLLVKPILQMIDATEALSKGHWQHHVSEPPSQELTLLAKAFNRMADYLQESFTQLEHNAYHDALTGLLNQTAFRVKLEEAIAQRDYQAAVSQAQNVTAGSLESGSKQFAVLFLDLDYFKLVNDSFGHLVGDQLLIAVTQRLATCVRFSDMMARFGGDEFVILLNSITQIADATQVAERILEELQHPFNLAGNEVFISASVGVVLSDNGGKDPDAFLRNADIALYQAKGKGKADYEVFDALMHTEVVKRLQMETDLRQAIERHELEVYYQPIIDISTQRINGFEALLRWHHPTLGMVSPVQFIPVAEETGLIVKLGWWVLRQACQQMRVWQQSYGCCQAMMMSVNLSSKQFLQSDLLEQIDRTLTETGLQPQNLKLEITESLFMTQTEATRFKLRRLRSQGIQLSIDDFGTGYSSLSYLHRFPINTLKIDRSFINHLGSRGENSEIIEAITVLAHKLGMSVVAEGVETIEQLDQVRAIGCEQVQGYLFSRPIAASSMTELLDCEVMHQTIYT
ncbi:MAG TPA: EAL domain-containing protein [Coleofasciculaceae cyanobacterium]